VPKLVIERVSKRYRIERENRDALAFTDVTLAVGDGEFVALVGPSGCGKTSLLNVVAGLLALEEGSVAIDGRKVIGPGIDRALVFQQPPPFLAHGFGERPLRDGNAETARPEHDARSRRRVREARGPRSSRR
jgi:NitT/TauT family transport system ATP-binding protein